MKLSDILTPGLIFNNIKSNQKDLCLDEIIKNICSFDKSLNYELTQKLVFEREKLCSTALDNYIAIPHAKNTIEARTLEQGGLLAAPHRCRGKVLSTARLEMNLGGVEVFGGCPHGLINATQRTATIARDEARSVEAPLLIPFSLQHWKSNQRLNACHVRGCVVVSVLVVQ